MCRPTHSAAGVAVGMAQVTGFGAHSTHNTTHELKQAAQKNGDNNSPPHTTATTHSVLGRESSQLRVSAGAAAQAMAASAASIGFKPNAPPLSLIDENSIALNLQKLEAFLDSRLQVWCEWMCGLRLSL